MKAKPDFRSKESFGIVAINKMNRILSCVDIYNELEDGRLRLGRRWAGKWRFHNDKQISTTQTEDLFRCLDWCGKFVSLIECKDIRIPSKFKNFLRQRPDLWMKETNDERINRKLDNISTLQYYELIYIFLFWW